MSKYLNIKYVMFLVLLFNVLYCVGIYYVNGKNTDIFLAPDSTSYLNPAKALLQKGKFLKEVDSQYYEVGRTPGYPILLLPGVLLRIPIIWAIILNIAFNLISIWYLYKICKLFSFSELASCLLCLLMGINLHTLNFVGLILTEIVFITFLTASLYYYLKAFEEKKLLYFILSFILSAYLAFIRPIAMYYFIILALYALYKGLQEHEKIFIKASLLGFLICSTLIGGWICRNKYLAGYPGFSGISATNLADYFGAKVISKLDGRDTMKICVETDSLIQLKMNKMTYPINQHSGIYYKLKGNYGKSILMSHIPTFAYLYLYGIFKTFVDPIYPHALLGKYSFYDDIISYSRLSFRTLLKLSWRGWYYIIEALIFLILFIIFCFIIIRYFKFILKDYKMLILILTVLYFIVLGGFHGLGRFRFPVEGIYFIIIYNGISKFISQKKSKHLNK